MAIDWMLLNSLYVVLSTVAMVTGLRLLAGMIVGHLTSEIIPVYFSTALVASVLGGALVGGRSGIAVMIEIITVLAVMSALHARYARWMRGAWRSLYAIATSVSIFTLGAGVTLQAVVALPELRAVVPALSRRALILTMLPFLVTVTVVIALAVRGLRRSGARFFTSEAMD